MLIRGSDTYRAHRGDCSGRGCSTDGRSNAAGGAAQPGLRGLGSGRRGPPPAAAPVRRPAHKPRRRGPRPGLAPGRAAGRRRRRARRPPPAAAAGRVSGTSHVTSRALARAARSGRSADTTSLAACGLSTDSTLHTPRCTARHLHSSFSPSPSPSVFIYFFPERRVSTVHLPLSTFPPIDLCNDTRVRMFVCFFTTSIHPSYLSIT